MLLLLIKRSDRAVMHHQVGGATPPEMVEHFHFFYDSQKPVICPLIDSFDPKFTCQVLQSAGCNKNFPCQTFHGER